MVNADEDTKNENDESSEHFGMEVISEGTINKEVVVPDETTVTKNGMKCRMLLTMADLYNQMWCVQKQNYIKM